MTVGKCNNPNHDLLTLTLPISLTLLTLTLLTLNSTDLRYFALGRVGYRAYRVAVT